MYMLRAISAVLHQDVGPAVPDAALDLRPGELAVVVPLVACLLGLSAYPNLVSGHAFGANHAKQALQAGFQLASIETALSDSRSTRGIRTVDVNCSPSPCHVVSFTSGDTVYFGMAPK